MTFGEIASSEPDAQAAEAVVRHHAHLAGALALQAERLAARARADREDAAVQIRDELVRWCHTELLPHAVAEEDTLYRAAARRPEGRLLVEAMRAEHETIRRHVEALTVACGAVDSAVAAGALRAVFDTHLAKENDQVLVLLASDPDVSLADLLAGLHDLLGGTDGPPTPLATTATSAKVDPTVFSSGGVS
jgi:hypothetical protein